MDMCSRFNMNTHDVRTSFRNLCDVLFWIFDHHVHIQNHICMWAECSNDTRAKRQVVNKVTIHDVNMYIISPGSFNLCDFCCKSTKVSSENRWCDFICKLFHVSSYFFKPKKALLIWYKPQIVKMTSKPKSGHFQSPKLFLNRIIRPQRITKPKKPACFIQMFPLILFFSLFGISFPR